MSTVLETTDTDDVLAAMLVENTGRHFLDSGGAYGRHFERNEGRTADDFRARPEAEPSTWERDGKLVVGYVNIDVFHFLRQRLDFDAALDAKFRDFAQSPEWADESWFACLDAWLDSIGAVGPDGDSAPIVVNTYNGEDALSQVIEYRAFRYPDGDETYIALMIHGGCDVRGGYTAPRLFSAGSYGGWYSMLDNARVTVVLTEPERVVPEGQDALFDVGPDRHGVIALDFDGGYGPERDQQPHDDPSLADITFTFGETAVVQRDGSYFIADDQPGAGWEVHFHGWPAG